MKKIFVGLLLISNAIYAENVKINLGKLNGRILSNDVKIEQVQTKVRCVFAKKNNGGYLIRRRYPMTYFSSGELSTKKVSLTEWLPGFETLSCAVVLVVVGKDQQNNTRMGDIILVGSMNNDMSRGDLEFMQSSEARVHVLKRLDDLKLGMGVVRGKKRIIEI